MIMELCMARLDMAMFNAILRESADEIPTVPVSDPISDSMVPPIPTGKSGFGAGALLKNARARQIYIKEWDPRRHSFHDDSNLHRLRDFIKHVCGQKIYW